MKQTWKDICRFQAFPKKSCTLQLFELHDEFIQQKITDTPQQTACSVGFSLVDLMLLIAYSAFLNRFAEPLEWLLF